MAVHAQCEKPKKKCDISVLQVGNDTCLRCPSLQAMKAIASLPLMGKRQRVGLHGPPTHLHKCLDPLSLSPLSRARLLNNKIIKHDVALHLFLLLSSLERIGSVHPLYLIHGFKDGMGPRI